MNRMIVRSRVGADGVLRVNVPVGKDEADQEVQVTVEPLAPKAAMTQEEWEAWVDSMAGTWKGDFERPPQLPLEEREPF
jgi:hypothetical protein